MRPTSVTPDSHSKNSHSKNARVEKFQGFPSSGGISPLKHENRLESNLRTSRSLLRESGVHGELLRSDTCKDRKEAVTIRERRRESMYYECA